jgi:hypothetical protein
MRTHQLNPIYWWRRAWGAWYWRKIRNHRDRMHALLKQWEVWKLQFAGMQMVANDYYYHNLDILMRRRRTLFRKMRHCRPA